MIVLICVLVAIAYLVHKWITKNNQYFADRNIPYIPQRFLAFFQKKSMPDMVTNWYNEFKNEKLVM